MKSLREGKVSSSESWKQKIQGQISTKSYLIGLYNILLKVLSWIHFIEAQGYQVEQNILNRDNKCTILHGTNGMVSFGSNTKHTKTQYFYVNISVYRGEMTIEY